MGEAVSGLEPGAHVIGADIGGGAFAQYMVLAALKPLGGVAAGQTVLIHAAAGATGQAAVKAAKHYGATVIGTASPGKHETVRALGANHVLDSRGADIAASAC